MAATQTVSQHLPLRNPTCTTTSSQAHAVTAQVLRVPRHGVVTLFGYGIKVRVEKGHLILEDGIGSSRREGRFPRVRHGLRRLVVIGADGMISLAALRWLADQDATFVMLDRDGSVLATTGPVRASDARLRRAQALVNESEAGLRIARELISQKLSAQERVARDKLRDSGVAQKISELRAAVPTATTVESIRLLEARGGAAYWSAWRTLSISFPKKDLHRVPDHWRTFGARESPLTKSPRKAANPVNAMLNYLYALLESEASIAAAALGLDPGLGVLHLDTPYRDSLACDLMEPVRPQVDAFVFDWITRTPLKREWFFEQRDGSCRLMASLTESPSETTRTWGGAVAPLAEWFARTVAFTQTKSARELHPATSLTQRHRREAKGAPSLPAAKSAPQPESICRVCGASIPKGDSYCASCAVDVARDHLIKAAKSGRVASQSAEAQARRSQTQRGHAGARWGWVASKQPTWLTNEIYDVKIQPLLVRVSGSAVASAIGVSIGYATDIRAGKRRPHPRHWLILAQLVGVTGDQSRALSLHTGSN